jgi:hypothetical protein
MSSPNVRELSPGCVEIGPGRRFAGERGWSSGQSLKAPPCDGLLARSAVGEAERTDCVVREVGKDPIETQG